MITMAGAKDASHPLPKKKEMKTRPLSSRCTLDARGLTIGSHPLLSTISSTTTQYLLEMSAEISINVYR